MTRREKMLAVSVGGALGCLGLYVLVRSVVVEPLVSIRQQIEAEQRSRTELKARLRKLAQVDAQWQEFAGQTLSTDPQDAQLRFRENVHELLARHGLVDDPKTKDTKVSPGNKTRDKNGFYDVPVTITTQGTLKEVLGFLTDFYRQGYLARLEKVTLTADQSIIPGTGGLSRRGGRAGGRGAANPRPGSPPGPAGPTIGPDGPDLTVSISATTLVLPRIGRIESKTMDTISDREPGQPGYNLPDEVVAYNEILEKSLFKPYQPPAVVQAPPTQPIAHPSPPPPPPPPPPPRPDADKWILVGTTKLNEDYIAYVLDEREKEKPLQVFNHDGQIDDGVLLLIHPRGVVVRAKQPDGKFKDFFYPLGKSFKEREELSRDQHPQVWDALREEFVDWDKHAANGVAEKPLSAGHQGG